MFNGRRSWIILNNIMTIAHIQQGQVTVFCGEVCTAEALQQNGLKDNIWPDPDDAVAGFNVFDTRCR